MLQEFIERLGLSDRRKMVAPNIEKIEGGLSFTSNPIFGEAGSYDAIHHFPITGQQLGKKEGLGIEIAGMGVVLEHQKDENAVKVSESLSVISQLANSGDHEDSIQRRKFRRAVAGVLGVGVDVIVRSYEEYAEETGIKSPFDTGNYAIIAPGKGGWGFPLAAFIYRLETLGKEVNQQRVACLQITRNVFSPNNLYTGSRFGYFPPMDESTVIFYIDDSMGTSVTLRSAAEVTKWQLRRQTGNPNADFQSPSVALVVSASAEGVNTFYQTQGGQVVTGGCAAYVDEKGTLRNEDGKLAVGEEMKLWTAPPPEGGRTSDEMARIEEIEEELTARWNKLGHWPRFTPFEKE